MMSIQRNAGWLLSFKGNMLLFLYIGKLPKITVLLNIRDFAVATRSNKLTFLSPLFKVLCSNLSVSTPCSCLFVIVSDANYDIRNFMCAHWITVWCYPIIVKLQGTLYYSTKTHPASKRCHNVLLKNSKILYWNPELQMATTKIFKVNTSIRCDLVWLPACNKEYHQQ